MCVCVCVCVCVCIYLHFLEFVVTRREGVAEINVQNESVNMYRKISRRLV